MNHLKCTVSTFLSVILNGQMGRYESSVLMRGLVEKKSFRNVLKKLSKFSKVSPVFKVFASLESHSFTYRSCPSWSRHHKLNIAIS